MRGQGQLHSSPPHPTPSSSAPSHTLDITAIDGHLIFCVLLSIFVVNYQIFIPHNVIVMMIILRKW